MSISLLHLPGLAKNNGDDSSHRAFAASDRAQRKLTRGISIVWASRCHGKISLQIVAMRSHRLISHLAGLLLLLSRPGAGQLGGLLSSIGNSVSNGVQDIFGSGGSSAPSPAGMADFALGGTFVQLRNVNPYIAGTSSPDRSLRARSPRMRHIVVRQGSAAYAVCLVWHSLMYQH